MGGSLVQIWPIRVITERRVNIDVGRVGQRGRHDANHFVGNPVERDNATNDLRIAAKPTLPQRFAEQNDVGTANPIVTFGKYTTKLGRYSHHSEIACGDECSAQCFRLAIPRQVEIVAPINRDVFETVLRGAPVEVIWISHGHFAEFRPRFSKLE